MTLSDVIAVFALAVSLVSVVLSIKADHRSKRTEARDIELPGAHLYALVVGSQLRITNQGSTAINAVSVTAAYRDYRRTKAFDSIGPGMQVEMQLGTELGDAVTKSQKIFGHIGWKTDTGKPYQVKLHRITEFAGAESSG